MMKIVGMLPVLCLLLHTTWGQSGNSKIKPDTIYFNTMDRKTSVKDSASSFLVRTFETGDSNRVKMTRHEMNGRLLGEKSFSDYKNFIKDGTWVDYYPAGNKSKETNYVNGKMEGPFITYWQDGKIKRRDIYRQDTLEAGYCYTREGKDTTYYAYSQEPKFPGGRAALMSYLSKSLKYPKTAQLDRISGTVYIRFTVNKDGSISDVVVHKGVSTLLDQEAVRVVSQMLAWIPGKMDGEPIKYPLILPVVFALSES